MNITYEKLKATSFDKHFIAPCDVILQEGLDQETTLRLINGCARSDSSPSKKTHAALSLLGSAPKWGKRQRTIYGRIWKLVEEVADAIADHTFKSSIERAETFGKMSTVARAARRTDECVSFARQALEAETRQWARYIGYEMLTSCLHHAGESETAHEAHVEAAKEGLYNSGDAHRPGGSLLFFPNMTARPVWDVTDLPEELASIVTLVERSTTVIKEELRVFLGGDISGNIGDKLTIKPEMLTTLAGGWREINLFSKGYIHEKSCESFPKNMRHLRAHHESHVSRLREV